MSINKVFISGNLTRDCEYRQTASGIGVCNFSVAVSDRRKNAKTGEWEDVPNYVRCTIFGRRADTLNRYLTKGTKVSIEGKLKYSKWTANDGQNRSDITVTVDEIELMSRREGGYNEAPPAPPAPPAPYVDDEALYADEDVPF